MTMETAVKKQLLLTRGSNTDHLKRDWVYSCKCRTYLHYQVHFNVKSDLGCFSLVQTKVAGVKGAVLLPEEKVFLVWIY